MTRRGTVTSNNRDSSVARRRTERLVRRVARTIGDRVRSHVHVCRRGVIPTLHERRVVFCRDGRRMRPFRRRFVDGFFGRRVFPCLRPIPMYGGQVGAFLHSGHLCLSMHIAHGSAKRGRCCVVGLPCDGIPHFVRLPQRKRGFCLVCVRSVVGTGVGHVFPNCSLSYDCYYGVSHSTSVFISSTADSRIVIRRLHGGIGGHGVNTMYHFICSHGVPTSCLRFLISTFNVGHSSLIPKSGRLGLRSLTRLPGPDGRLYARLGPHPVALGYLSRGRSVFHCIDGGSLVLRFPCRSFRRFVRFLCRTIRSPSYGRVVVARCEITRGSIIVGALVTTTRGNGGMAIFMRLGTHFSRRGGLTATRVVGQTKVRVVFDVPKLGIRTGITLMLQCGGRKGRAHDCTCVDAKGFGRGATQVCTSSNLFASGRVVIGSLCALFQMLRGRIARPGFGHLLMTHFGLLPRLEEHVKCRVGVTGTKGRTQVVLGVGTLRSPTVVSRLCGTDRTKIGVSLVMHNVYYLVPGRPCDEGVHVAHVISDFLRRTQI